ncbi:hypothetical protein HHL11_11850 [Ramlibacter sp. G-1-2-2]|uniref:Uncharacterized protein n=1 Tax=Ramlibacter agri TaxID=2728837 RepID=A0A848HA11_9BURK|nr:hypothetical protein [Ramlibacter agri]NML44448.1 hypothetical protein [Ramlibacter agri]
MGREFDRNFFAQIQGKFTRTLGDEKGPDFQGRYIGHILHALSLHRPRILDCLPTDVDRKPARCEPEFRYSKGKERIADLAVFAEGEAAPFLLVEIKAADGANTAHNHPQLKAYAKWANEAPAGQRHVVVLTQYPLPAETRAIIASSGGALLECSIGSFARALARTSGGSELTGTFLEYLYSKGLVMTPLDAQDMEALHTFLAFSFLPHLGGQGRVTSSERVTNGPKAFATIVQNWQLLSGHYADLLRKKGAVVRNPVVKFVAEQRGGGSRKTGGHWALYSRYAADRGTKKGGNKQADLYHEFGLFLDIEKAESGAEKGIYSLSIYSCFTVGGTEKGGVTMPLVRRAQDRAKDYAAFARTLSDEEKLLKALRSCVVKACEAVEDPDARLRLKQAKANLLF